MRRRHRSATSTASAPAVSSRDRQLSDPRPHDSRDSRGACRRGPADAAGARPDLPEPLLAAVDTALEPDPARRFPDAASMEAALARALPEGRQSDRQADLPGGWESARSSPSRGWDVWVGRPRDAVGAVGPCRSLAVSKRRGASDRFLRTPSRRAWRALARRPPPVLCGESGRPGDPRDRDRQALGGHRETAPRKRQRIRRDVALHGRRNEGCSTSGIRARKRSQDANGERPTEIRSIPIRGGEPSILWSDTGNSELVLKHWSGEDRADPRQRVESGTALAARGRRPRHGDCPRGPSHRNHVAERRLALPRRNAHRLRQAGSGDPTARYLHRRRRQRPGDPLIRDGSSDHSPIWTRDGRVRAVSERSLGANSHSGHSASKPRVRWGARIRVEPNLGWAYPMGETARRRLFLPPADGYPGRVCRRARLVGCDRQRAGARSTEVVGANGASDWSPDGKQLTFFRRRDDRWSLVVKSIDDGREREINDPNIAGIGRPRWEPAASRFSFKSTYQRSGGSVTASTCRPVRSRRSCRTFFGHYNLVPTAAN